MKRKILTTHVGSLPRSKKVTELLFSQENIDLERIEKKIFNETEAKTILVEATDSIVTKQKDLGISIPSDGEVSKISYATYIKDRLTGFEGDSPRNPPADLKDFPSYLTKIARSGGTPTYTRPQCISYIKVKTLQPLYDDISRYKSALQKVSYKEAFMNSVSPGTIALFQPSIYHKSHQEYLENIAEAMKSEYEEIIKSGLMLQIDSPDLGLGRHMMFTDKTDEEYLKVIQLHIQILNDALINLPAEKIRLHVCWGNYEGPHHHDISLAKILPILLEAKPRNLLFESSNPRHAHEWKIWKGIKIPDDYVLIPGVIDSTTNFIEHPQVVAERIEKFTNIIGKDRVIAGTDCGFATFAGFGSVDENIVWEKLKSLVEGAEIASNR